MVFDTLHAITLTSSQGAEILIHIGLDTVTLKGAPFTAHVAAGDKVKKGDLLMDVDLDKIKEAGLNYNYASFKSAIQMIMKRSVFKRKAMSY